MIAKPKRGSFVGEEKRYDIVVDIAGSEVTTQPANCQLHHKPFIRSWGRIIRTFIALALIAIVLYILIQLGGGWSKLIHHPGDWWETLVDKLT
jgi:hypothetical protein